jgi:hypothetical protein
MKAQRLLQPMCTYEIPEPATKFRVSPGITGAMRTAYLVELKEFS